MTDRPWWMTGLLYLAALLLALLAIGPAFWLIATAFAPTTVPVNRLPEPNELTLANFRGAWEEGRLFWPMINSLIVTAVQAVANVLLAAMAAYPLARMRFPGRSLIFMLILATIMIPEQVIVVPLFATIVGLGLYDTLAAVVLPVLPDRTFGPYAVFNPFETWLLVVLIVAINLAGYIALRLFGTGGGLWMAGIFGGLVSSTATAVGYAGLSRESRQFALPATLIILLASTVVYARIGVELAVVAPGLLPVILPPMAVYSAFLLALCAAVFMRIRRADAQPELPDSRNPARIPAALAFGAAYAVILFAIAAARDQLGDEAIYAVALISGLTDVDALTLSVGQLFTKANLDGAHAWRAIFVGTLSNLAFKAAAASVLGSAELRRYILLATLPALFGGALLLWLWP